MDYKINYKKLSYSLRRFERTQRLKINKATGLDGLTLEFYKLYKAFFDDVKNILADTINEGFRKGELSYLT